MAFRLVPRSVLHSLIQVSNVGSTPSSIVATSSSPRTSGSFLSPASCTSALWVRVQVLGELTATLMANIVDIATGIRMLYGDTVGLGSGWLVIEYLLASTLLSILLTLMIVIRLVLHTRNTRAAMGVTGIGGLYKAVITMLIESCALDTASSLLVIGSSTVSTGLQGLFWPIFTEIQVRAFPRSDLRIGPLI